MSAARNDPDRGRDDLGWSLPPEPDPRADTGSLWRNPVTGPNAFGLGDQGSSGAGATWRGRSGSGSFDPDEPVFDIADDRRDDVTGWGAPRPAEGSNPVGHGSGSSLLDSDPGRARTTSTGRGRHARPDDDEPWPPLDVSTPSADALYTSSRSPDPLHDPLPGSPYSEPSEPRYTVSTPEPQYAPPPGPRYAPEPRYAPPPDPLPATTAPAVLPGDAEEMVARVRESFAAVAPRADELTQLFYGLLFGIAPETRDLFPATMELQRTRLLRALIHFVQMADRPDELAVFLRQLGRDHRKFGVVAAHYDKVGEALVGALKEISGPGWTPETEQAWLRAYGVLSSVMSEAADAERGPAVWMARVVEHRRVSSDVAVVRVQTSQPVPYLAGQYVSVEIPQRPRMWRTLSPANAPGSDCVLEFHVHTVPGGWVSRAMVSHVSVGEVWRIGPPMGQMTLDPKARGDLLMVTGGTGLAPARALVEQIMIDGTDRKVALFVGGRTWDSLYDIDTLRRMAQDHPWLTVVPVVEEDGSRYGAETGTLGQVVARYGAWADRQVVVSGSPAMVRSTVSAMLDAGTPFTQIHHDPQHTD